MNSDLAAQHVTADRAGLPRWAWPTLAAVVAVAVAAVGGFAVAMTRSPDGGSPSASGVSSSAPASAPTQAASAAPKSVPPTPKRTATPAPTLRAIPVGWTLWKIENGAFAVRRLGETVSIAQFGEPCFTGESAGASTYRGGGISQQGTYLKQTWTVKMIDASHILLTNGDYEVRGQLVNADRVPTKYGGITLTDLQQGC